MSDMSSLIPTRAAQDGDKVDVSKHIYLCFGCGKTLDDRTGKHSCVPHTARMALVNGPIFAQEGRLTIDQAMTRHLRVLAEAREQYAYRCRYCNTIHTDIYDGRTREWREPDWCTADEWE